CRSYRAWTDRRGCDVRRMSMRNGGNSIMTLSRWIVLLAAMAPGETCLAQTTLQAVKERGTLNCGVSLGLKGFSSTDEKGEWAGFDVDLCRAVAAAIFDDPARVTFVPLSTNERFAALRSGAIDLLSRNTTWTMSRETALGLRFVAVTYYDGQ